MKTIILSGGLGTRLSEETVAVPKPMVTIGGKPLLWHIMKIYAHHGFEDFTLALGYKAEVIKEYVLNLRLLSESFEVDLRTQDLRPLAQNASETWKILALDTGESTQTGGRIKRSMAHAGNESSMVTYGDGVGDIDIEKLVAFHRSHGKLCTLTAVRPPARFGRLELQGSQVTKFGEKLQAQEGWINGGFMVLEPSVADLIEGDQTAFENEPLAQLAGMGQLMAFFHEGFWQPMDTLRERQDLETLWSLGQAPWRVWD